MPNGGGDDYTTGVFGHFLVDDGDDVPGETIELTFTIRSDDGSALHIFGDSFTEKGGNASGTLVDIDGDVMLVGDFFTGNTDVLGLIELTEGVHSFEGYHFEGGGGDYFDIWFAAGNQLAGFNSNVLSAEHQRRTSDPANVRPGTGSRTLQPGTGVPGSAEPARTDPPSPG